MKAVIIDDEVSLREALKSLLRIDHPDVEVVGEASSVNTGYEVIVDTNPDLVFLDIEITSGTGFDLLARFEEVAFKIIFVTAHNEHAVRAFKFSAVDYLLKPVDPLELAEAIKKARNSLPEKFTKYSSEVLHGALSSRKIPKKILLKDHESIHLVDTEEIIRCEAAGNYTRFHLLGGKTLLISKTLKEFDTLFSSEHFFRAHQSHLINLNYFLRLDKAEGGSIVLKDNSVLPVATRKKDLLMDKLEHFTK